jgi:hypothetical protein
VDGLTSLLGFALGNLLWVLGGLAH